ncbi:FAD-dependent oxidoreductase [Paenibacillus amylolyticus]|nr:FAD-dependent oxidoreductase [Paenibacillus amylolyticus]
MQEALLAAAAGMLAADSEDFAHPLMAKLARQSRQLLIEQQVLMATLSEVETGLQCQGFLTPFRSYSELSSYKDNRKSAFSASADEVWWDRSVVQQEASWLNRDTYGAYYRPYESEILPVHLTKAYAESAQAFGARVMEDIQDIRVQANEHGVQGITTSIGEMRCKHVIIAAGLQSEELMRHVNLSMPVWSVKGEIAAVQFSDEHAGYRPDRTVYAEDIYIVPKANGEVWLGGNQSARQNRSERFCTGCSEAANSGYPLGAWDERSTIYTSVGRRKTGNSRWIALYRCLQEYTRAVRRLWALPQRYLA